MILNLKYNKSILAIFIIWLFHISAIIGIFLGYEKWFLSLTPLNLLICIGAIIWVESHQLKKILLALLIPFFLGFIAEWLGVHYGFIFGNYNYGKNLGWKIDDIPIMIGINWAILVYSATAISRKLFDSIINSSLSSSILMVVLDIIMEKCAPHFDFWQFNSNIVPIQNYIGWFLVSFLANYFFLLIIKKQNIQLALSIYIIFFIFFAIFAIQYF